MMDLLFLVRWMVRERVSVSLMRDEREGWIAELLRVSTTRPGTIVPRYYEHNSGIFARCSSIWD